MVIVENCENYVLHSVSEYKKRYIRNSTQILENLRNVVVGFFGLRNKFVNVQRNKKRSTQNVFKLRNRKKYTHTHTVQWPRAIKPKSQNNWWC